ncbi:MAG: hypothetical protein LBB40_05880 [Holophagales bacterium]|jgi:hypothetical protein|nr:hypothetical protein [Holophagales bacterium]
MKKKKHPGMTPSKDFKYSRPNTKGLFALVLLLAITTVFIVIVARAETRDLPRMLETITSALLGALEVIKSNCKWAAFLLLAALVVSVSLLKENERINERRVSRLTEERDRLQNKLMEFVGKDSPC